MPFDFKKEYKESYMPKGKPENVTVPQADYHNIETERLLLKSIDTDDRDFMLKQFSDSDVNEFLFDADPLATLEEADELIDFYTIGEPKGQHRWIIIDKQSGEKIGTCGFHCLNEAEKCVDVGYDLQKAYWGRGIMTEAMTAMFSEYVPKLGVTRVYAHIAIGNERSEHLAEKLGFIPSGKTEILRFHGKDYSHNIYVFNT